jgi:hypothetical protein
MVSFPGLAASTQRVNKPPYARATSAPRLTRARTAVDVESSMRMAAAANRASFSPFLSVGACAPAVL